MTDAATPDVIRLGPPTERLHLSFVALCASFGLRTVHLPASAVIPGSYWGAPEAGLRGDCLFVRSDTPVTSALHEACHFLCMDDARRAMLDTDAGGDVLEECAVCYLSVLLADHLCDYDATQMLEDMDRWGYSFRLGSARAWFEADAEDARAWLARAGWLERGAGLAPGGTGP